MEIVEIMNIFHWETTIFHNQHFLVNSEYHRDILYGYNEHIYIYNEDTKKHAILDDKKMMLEIFG